MSEEKSLTYKIDLDKNLLTEIFVGNYDIDDVLAFQKKVYEDKRYNRPLNVLLDLRRSTPQFSVNELDNLVMDSLKYGKTSKDVKIAFLSDLPRHVVDSVIIESIFKSKKVKAEAKAFSTLEAALDWLNIQH
jgi:lipoate synthase